MSGIVSINIFLKQPLPQMPWERGWLPAVIDPDNPGLIFFFSSFSAETALLPLGNGLQEIKLFFLKNKTISPGISIFFHIPTYTKQGLVLIF